MSFKFDSKLAAKCEQFKEYEAKDFIKKVVEESEEALECFLYGFSLPICRNILPKDHNVIEPEDLLHSWYGNLKENQWVDLRNFIGKSPASLGKYVRISLIRKLSYRTHQTPASSRYQAIVDALLKNEEGCDLLKKAGAFGTRGKIIKTRSLGLARLIQEVLAPDAQKSSSTATASRSQFRSNGHTRGLSLLQQRILRSVCIAGILLKEAAKSLNIEENQVRQELESAKRNAVEHLNSKPTMVSIDNDDSDSVWENLLYQLGERDGSLQVWIASPDVKLLAKERREVWMNIKSKLKEIFLNLSQQQKKIVVRRSNGMPSKEVADALNITVNNVDVVYSQAKKQMGKMIRQDATLMQQIEETLQFHKKEIVDNDN